MTDESDEDRVEALLVAAHAEGALHRMRWPRVDVIDEGTALEFYIVRNARDRVVFSGYKHGFVRRLWLRYRYGDGPLVQS
jgi:hypothetical protein